MSIDKFKAAKREAQRFIDLVDAALEREAKEKKALYRCYATKENGAVKRASMDLTRALADLRKS